MTEQHTEERPDWPALLERINREVSAINPSERTWLYERVTAIAGIQHALNELFTRAGGSASCAACDGACCDCGRHHFTLTNLLAYLLVSEVPPAPDFTQSCPFLGGLGCRLPVARRPYNCITFFCETLEDQLDNDDREQLRSLDRQLRREYQLLENRYPAASLRGLWIALERVGGGHLLITPEQDVVK